MYLSLLSEKKKFFFLLQLLYVYINIYIVTEMEKARLFRFFFIFTTDMRATFLIIWWPNVNGKWDRSILEVELHNKTYWSTKFRDCRYFSKEINFFMYICLKKNLSYSNNPFVLSSENFVALTVMVCMRIFQKE